MPKKNSLVEISRCILVGTCATVLSKILPVFTTRQLRSDFCRKIEGSVNSSDPHFISVAPVFCQCFVLPFLRLLLLNRHFCFLLLRQHLFLSHFLLLLRIFVENHRTDINSVILRQLVFLLPRLLLFCPPRFLLFRILILRHPPLLLRRLLLHLPPLLLPLLLLRPLVFPPVLVLLFHPPHFLLSRLLLSLVLRLLLSLHPLAPLLLLLLLFRLLRFLRLHLPLVFLLLWIRIPPRPSFFLLHLPPLLGCLQPFPPFAFCPLRLSASLAVISR